MQSHTQFLLMIFQFINLLRYNTATQLLPSEIDSECKLHEINDLLEYINMFKQQQNQSKTPTCTLILVPKCFFTSP